MILRKTNEVQAFGIENSQSFQINASAHAFRILSDGLYSDKISSILRELSSNALDSHIAKGITDTPFTIHIPTKLSPHFYIRDYGTGLSEEDIFGLYSTYFASTKGESNDFVGALGLGSKSPFSYTDSFTVDSWFNGTHKTYAVFIGVNGTPTITKIYEEDIIEETGLKISFECKESDIREWEDKASLLNEFDTIPDINISLPNKKEIALEFPDAEIRKSNSYYVNYYAKQGPVLYKIDSSVIPSSFMRFNNSIDIVLKFNLGEISFTASREEISLDEGTSLAIKNRLEKLQKDINNYIEEKLKLPEGTSLYMYNENVNTIIKELPIKINTSDFYKDYKYIETLEDGSTKELNSILDQYGFFRDVLKKEKLDLYLLKNNRLRKDDGFYLHSKAKFILLDTKSHRESIKQYLQKNPEVKKVFTIIQEDLDILINENIIDDSYVIKMSDIRIRLTPKERAKIKQESVDPKKYRYYNNGYDYWITKSEFDEITDGYYIPFEMMNDYNEGLRNILGSILEELNVSVYGINKIFQKSTKLKPLSSLLKQKRIKNKINDILISKRIYKEFDTTLIKIYLNGSTKIKRLFEKYIPEFKYILKDENYTSFNMFNINRILSPIDTNYLSKNNSFEIKSNNNTFLKKFPLFERMHSYNSSHQEEYEIYILAKAKLIKN